eukprot:304588-Pyramimonas_sp.AAC.1
MAGSLAVTVGDITSGTHTLHTPNSSRVPGWALVSHPLKSPTRLRLEACGAHSMYCTNPPHQPRGFA